MSFCRWHAVLDTVGDTGWVTWGSCYQSLWSESATVEACCVLGEALASEPPVLYLKILFLWVMEARPSCTWTWTLAKCGYLPGDPPARPPPGPGGLLGADSLAGVWFQAWLSWLPMDTELHAGLFSAALFVAALGQFHTQTWEPSSLWDSVTCAENREGEDCHLSYKEKSRKTSWRKGHSEGTLWPEG